MRRVIRHKETGHYFAEGAWTPDHRLAQTFPGLYAIAQLKTDLDLSGAEIVLQVGPEPSQFYDVPLPLRPFTRPETR